MHQKEQQPPRLKGGEGYSPKTEEEMASSAEQTEQKGFLARHPKLDNFWFHYKWHTLIIGFFVIFFIITGVQTATKDTWDVHVLYTGPAYLDRDVCEAMISSMSEASYAVAEEQGASPNPADYSGDGRLTVDLNKYVYVPQKTAEDYKEQDIYFNGEHNVQALGDFHNAIVIGEYVILLIEESLYRETAASGVFAAWEETLGYTPEGALDAYGILLEDIDLGSMNGFNQLPKGTVLCCRGKSYINRFNKKVQNEKMYASEVALFGQLVTYKEASES